MRSENSHHHLLLAVRVLWLHFQLFHIAVADLGPLPGALAFGPCERERRGHLVAHRGSPAPRPPSVPTQNPRGSRKPSIGRLDSPGPAAKAGDFRSTHRPRARHTAQGAAGAARPSGVSCWSEWRGAGVGLGEGARASVWRPGDAARLCSLSRSAPLFPAPLAPAAPVARRWVPLGSRRALRSAGLRARSTASLRPPRSLLNPLLPSQRASSLICRTTR